MKKESVLVGQMSIFNFVEECVNPHDSDNRALEAFFGKKYGKQRAKDMMHCNIIQVRTNKAGRKIFVDHGMVNKSGVPAVYEMFCGERRRRYVDWLDFEQTNF